MVVTHPTTGHQLCIGVDLAVASDLRKALEDAEASGCDFITVPLVHPRYERLWSPVFDGAQRLERVEPLSRSAKVLNSGEWIDGIIGKFSPWIRTDSTNFRIRELSEQAFSEEYDYASHLSLKAVLTPAIKAQSGVANLARNIAAALSRNSVTQIWVRLPVTFYDVATEQAIPDVDSWELWNQIRTLCSDHPNLAVALELTSHVPSREVIDRWAAEPVQMVAISVSAFVTNKAGYPVLQRRHKEFVTSVFRYKCLFSISGNPARFGTGSNEGVRPFVMFLAHLFGKLPAGPNDDVYDRPYLDYLQSPLQPLADNLESSMYEVFEKDPVKYARYEEAARLHLAKLAQPRVVIMVLGAGRGPLVDACLNAADANNKQVVIYAIEKNPNAVITLRNLCQEPRWSNVQVVSTDMRLWRAPEKADVIVSELLGSFGDNELSPECLADVYKFLAPGGVSIPSSSTSYLAPVSSQVLHSQVRNLGEARSNFETPYVVKIHRAANIDAPQQCFTFVHPETPKSGEPVPDFGRYVELTFYVPENYVLHGFSGYFEAVLCDHVDISIRPETHTPKMFSWFPMYFPIREPVFLPKNSNLVVHLWRRTSEEKVWYEWCVTSPVYVPIHNINGRSSAMNVAVA